MLTKSRQRIKGESLLPRPDPEVAAYAEMVKGMYHHSPRELGPDYPMGTHEKEGRLFRLNYSLRQSKERMKAKIYNCQE